MAQSGIFFCLFIHLLKKHFLVSQFERVTPGGRLVSRGFTRGHTCRRKAGEEGWAEGREKLLWSLRKGFS